MQVRGTALLALLLPGIFGWPLLAETIADEEPYPLPAMEVSALTPLGVLIEGDRVPSSIVNIERDELDSKPVLSLNDALQRRVGSVTISDTQNNPLQPELSFRGFTVSPLLGLPQGLAVYQDGARINEAFGDTVNFELVPEFAINRVSLLPGSNPMYGLNALGGTIALEMKDGFSAAGTEIALMGGSFGRAQATAQHGWNDGRHGFYIGANRFSEDGWRDYSESDLSQLHASFSRRGNPLELDTRITLVESDLNGNGAAPLELLEARREAVYTHPDNTRNRLVFIQGNGAFRINDTLSLQGNAWYRRMIRHTTNGDETDLEDCDDAPAWLCEEDGDGPIATDLEGEPIPVSSIGGEPFAVYNRSRTETDSIGFSLQATSTRQRNGRDNIRVLGASFMLASTDFGNNTEMGTLSETRSVHGSGIFLGGDTFNTALESDDLHASVFGANVVALGAATDLTISGRFNHSRIRMNDQLGEDLDGEHVFNRFNPAIGLAWRRLDNTTLHAGYSETNRVPTAAELSCADPEQPCRFPHAFVADPPLEQVVSRTLEFGARGRIVHPESRIDWSITPFLSMNEDDIIFVSAGPVVGSGFFQNASRTRRVGLEAAAEGRSERLEWFVSYGYVNATFEGDMMILSDHNPAANEDGDIEVSPGDRLAGIPLHSAKLGFSYDLMPRWSIGLETFAASSRVFRGDEGNDQDEVDGFVVFSLRSAYRFNDTLELYVLVDNLLDAGYETFGTFGEADENPLKEVPGGFATDPRFLGPGAPRGAWIGARLRLD